MSSKEQAECILLLFWQGSRWKEHEVRVDLLPDVIASETPEKTIEAQTFKSNIDMLLLGKNTEEYVT